MDQPLTVSGDNRRNRSRRQSPFLCSAVSQKWIEFIDLLCNVLHGGRGFLMVWKAEPSSTRTWVRGDRPKLIGPGLAGIGSPSAVAQPQAHEMASRCGFGVIDKGGAAMAQRAIVDELQLPRFEVEIE
jgi:hypothetical protein